MGTDVAAQTENGAGAEPPRPGPFSGRRHGRYALTRILAKRALLAVVLLFVVSILSFLLISVTPGDPARQILGLHGTPEQYAALRQELGLNEPVYVQYWNWLSHAIGGDFGSSIYGSEAVSTTLSDRLPVTLSLMILSLIVSLIIGVFVGVLSAVRGGFIDRSADALSLLGFALPPFWVGAVLISFFAVNLGLFPATGYVTLDQSPVEWIQSLVLPVVALSIGGVALISKQTRDAMIESLGSEYIRTARANGASEQSIIYRHALRNAGVLISTVLGVLAVGLLGGTIVVESVFALPGLGSLAVQATARHDIPVVQAIVVYFTVIVLIVNFLVDLAAAWLNPKLRIT